MKKYNVTVWFGMTLRAKDRIDAINLTVLELDRTIRKTGCRGSGYCKKFTVREIGDEK